MSNLETDPVETRCGGGVAVAPRSELLAPREVVLGGVRGSAVRRTLPHRDRRMVGAWCFVDEFGPDDVSRGSAMRVPPHPHTGLQTVSWLLQGEVRHLDSLGTEQLIRPGQLNLMTAGRGIAHAEEPLATRSRTVQGVQLWVALPDEHRDADPHFEHHADLAVFRHDGVAATVLLGELAGVASPATAYTPIVGADAVLAADVDARIPADPRFEYAVLVLAGTVEVAGVWVPAGSLLYLGADRGELALRTEDNARVLIIGGEPFDESIVMWWNFIGRSHEEIVQMRADWMEGDRFGIVHGFDGDPLPAPAMPTTRLRPRPRRR